MLICKGVIETSNEETLKKRFFGIKILIVFIVLLSFVVLWSNAVPSEHPRKIVVFKKWFSKIADQEALLKNSGAEKIKHLKLINSTAVHLPPQVEKALRKKGEILRIDEDLIISAVDKKATNKGNSKKHQPSEELPWGIYRIYAELAWTITKGSTIKVAILDTGIDLDHPDLLDNIKGDINIVKLHKSANDNNGHGTHVAGIVAATDNDIGVIGTGPEISLYAVEVLDKNGNGWLSDLIDGLDWCISNNIQVVNMSLGSLKDNQSFYDAIIKAYQAGITLVASAGNNGDYDGLIEFPAKYPETIAVSAVDEYCQFPSFSSYGPEIDLTAPGVNIKSTYIKASYKTLSGTSMAAAHVTGLVALLLTTTPTLGYDIDGDGIWDPPEIKKKLKDTAEVLILLPYQQGAGLARADCIL